ncbi:YigZ family protein [Enterococcus sp. JM4C]|uniref:YigZ family protein n=1 Tax=Candidatus Enterococcus huntleyi TaxID=1857217 RepID=UPI00137A3CF0|nr:YigZ family protein [Enterococcus sp. JM4C]KAF1295768.1 YigZ family protein [Enterococcus sp. JM4C]
MDQYITIKENYQTEIEIKKSRFICFLKRIETEEQAKSFIQEIKKEHWKANHNCSAFVLGENQAIQRSSDDGEPSGTAGVPMLEVLKKNQVMNVAAVVTRYFGGTKLGAGGLIRAYSGAVAQAIAEIGLVRGVLQQEVLIHTSYPLLGKVQNFLELNQYVIKETLYTEAITVIAMVDQAELAVFQASITDLLNGQVTFEEGETSYVETLIS